MDCNTPMEMRRLAEELDGVERDESPWRLRRTERIFG